MDELRATPEYQKQVESLMLGQRSAKEFEKWVKNYDNMNEAFGERMGLDPKVVRVMVENIRKAHVDIDAGKAEAPESIPNPRKNRNLNFEKTIGTGKNSVYLYYDQQKRERAESKGENVWECNIGETIREPHTRINEKAEEPKIGLHIKTNKHKNVERIIHDILKVRGKHIPEADRTDWFRTSPSEVEEIYNSIRESSCENVLDR